MNCMCLSFLESKDFNVQFVTIKEKYLHTRKQKIN
uniref:Uncharacterized protein n=1 Tax=Anguilla anguilla TaxID=7936 RepID=A0A0E9PMH8_ANGAN